jgi:Reverse transcriptase (RNA-dependent DNA polymerase)
MLTASALLGKGYFPKELPPPFETRDLAANLSALEASSTLTGGATECVGHNLARVSGTRRPLRVPNPRSFILLARELQQQWSAINAHLKTANLAISRPVVTRTHERAVRPQFHIREKAHRRALTWPARRYVLRTDISQFYSSIYTHAIPWALHSKTVAKANKGETDGDLIDKAIRNCASGQTTGVPIGPDTSLVVAEIILTAVDNGFSGLFGNCRGFRYLDDYELAFESRAEAEEGLALLEVSLGKFELVLNPYKTRILELPQPFKDRWTTELATWPVRTDSHAKTDNDLIGLFSRAAEIATSHPGCLNYALRKSRNIPITRDTWPLLQSLVWGAVSAEPTAMATALDLLNVKADEVNSTVSKEPASEVLEAVIRRHAPIQNASEVAWALWAALTLGAGLSADMAKRVASVDDDFVALLALDASARGRFPAGALDANHWATLVADADAFQSDHWLLAYEGAVRGWLTSAAEHFKKDPFFASIQRAGVHFYDPNPPREPFTGPAAPLPGGLDFYE